MPDEKKVTNEEPDQSSPEKFEIRIESSGPVDWGSALKELEEWDKKIPAAKTAPAKPEAASAAPKPPAEPKKEEYKAVPAEEAPAAEAKEPETAEESAPEPEEDEATRKRREGMKRYEELCKTPSMKIESEDLKIINELSEILSSVNTAVNQLKRFEEKHPYLIAPNVFRVWEDNLKETATIMFREFHNLRNGKKKKVYDKRYVCNECHSVFMMPLPEGICDECRSRKAAEGAAPY
ncbi:hypothetical protein KQI84_03510 [bacterium]|nr:hypothetical protein [bacterium]